MLKLFDFTESDLKLVLDCLCYTFEQVRFAVWLLDYYFSVAINSDVIHSKLS